MKNPPKVPDLVLPLLLVFLGFTVFMFRSVAKTQANLLAILKQQQAQLDQLKNGSKP